MNAGGIEINLAGDVRNSTTLKRALAVARYPDTAIPVTQVTVNLSRVTAASRLLFTVLYQLDRQLRERRGRLAISAANEVVAAVLDDERLSIGELGTAYLASRTAGVD